MVNVINSYDKNDTLKVVKLKSHQSVTVHVTSSDNNEGDIEAYISLLRERYPYVNIVCGRMNVFNIMQNHFSRMIKQDSKFGARATVTTIAFCGSTYLGSIIDHTKEKIQWLLEMDGADNHRIHLVQENYGHGESSSNKGKK